MNTKQSTKRFNIVTRPTSFDPSVIYIPDNYKSKHTYLQIFTPENI